MCGQRIRELRNIHNLTQENVSDYLQISVRSLSQIETGARGLTVNNAIAIAQLFKVSLDYLYMGTETVKSSDKSVIDFIEQVLLVCSDERKDELSDALIKICNLVVNGL